MKNIILATLALAILSVGVQFSHAVEIKGNNVTSVRYDDPDNGQEVQINMNPNNHSQWQEHSPNGPFNFVVAARDEWSVYLWDANRGMVMQIDLHQKVIKYGAGNAQGQMTSQFGSYPIKSSQ